MDGVLEFSAAALRSQEAGHLRHEPVRCLLIQRLAPMLRTLRAGLSGEACEHHPTALLASRAFRHLQNIAAEQLHTV